MKLTTPELLILAVLVILGGFLTYDYMSNNQCAFCGSEWQYIGRATASSFPSTLNIASIVSTYNANIQSSGKTLVDISKFQECQLPIDTVYRYKQNGQYYSRIVSGTNSLIQSEADNSNRISCASGGQIALQTISPKSCNLCATCGQSVDPTLQEFSVCTGVTMDFAIPSADVRTVECQTGQTKTKTCWDGSQIVSANCINNQWKTSANKCPVQPVCTNTCNAGETRGAYPGCACTPNQSGNTTVCSNTCGPNQNQGVYPGCQCTDIIPPNTCMYPCIAGQVQASYPDCSCTTEIDNGNGGNGGTQPPQNYDSLINMAIILGAIVLIAGAAIMLFTSKKRK